MKSTKKINAMLGRMLIVFLLVCLMLPLVVSCSQQSEIPDGYQYATCDGAYFRLFIPTQWKTTTESGISGGIYSARENVTVSMIREREVHALDENSPDVSGVLEEKTTAEAETGAETETDQVAQETALHYAVLCGQEYETSMKRYKQTSLFRTVMGRRAAIRMEYSALVGETEYKYFQVYAKYKGYFYVFTYAAPTDYYQKRLEMAEEILGYVTFAQTPFEGKNNRQPNDGADAPDGMRLISGEDVAYRFYAPKSWKIDPNMGQSAVYFSAEDHSNISVSGHMPSEQNLTMGGYKDALLQEYEGTFDSFTLISDTSAEENQTDLTMDGKPAIRIVYDATLGGQAYRVDQTLILHGAMVYLITYTATPERFDDHTADLTAVLDAFRFR